MAVGMSGRDRAVVLLLAGLGRPSRGGAGLRLDDIDWRAGRVMITGKGNHHQLMPLPAEVGEALASYLRHDRGQRMTHRHVFLAATPPCEPLDRSGVSSIVARLASAFTSRQRRQPATRSTGETSAHIRCFVPRPCGC